jgi:RNA polymerase sigma factor (TIGR02999 family)
MIAEAARQDVLARTAEVADSLLAQCYADMRRIARSLLGGDRMRVVIQPTELAHEAAIRLMNSDAIPSDDKAHMLALAAKTMRRILIDEVRKAKATKRQIPEAMTEWPGIRSIREIQLEDLDLALAALSEFSPEHAQIIEMRYTLGLTVEETVLATGIPERTVKRRWQAARVWLHDYMTRSDDTDPPGN